MGPNVYTLKRFCRLRMPRWPKLDCCLCLEHTQEAAQIEDATQTKTWLLFVLLECGTHTGVRADWGCHAYQNMTAVCVWNTHRRFCRLRMPHRPKHDCCLCLEHTQEAAQIEDATQTNLVNLRRTIYLTIMSSLDFEEVRVCLCLCVCVSGGLWFYEHGCA